jgi:hypothetical protein
MMLQRTGLRTVALAQLAFTLAAGGCGKQKAQVNGTVKFTDGKPVTAGTITFWIDDFQHGSGSINGDGSYTVNDAPVGDAKVLIDTPTMTMNQRTRQPAQAPPGLGAMPSDKMPPGMGAPIDPSQITPVNEKYKSHDTTPLSCKVGRGSQKQDFTVEP